MSFCHCFGEIFEFVINGVKAHPEAIFGIIGAVTGAMIGVFFSFYQSESFRDRNAKYLAVRVIFVLEKFSQDCLEVLFDDGTIEGEPSDEDETCSPQIDAPGPVKYPDDLDWQSIDDELMYDLLSLPNDIEYAANIVYNSGEYAHAPYYEEFFLERRNQYKTLGIRALDLSEEIGKKYKVRSPKSLSQKLRKKFAEF